MRLFGRRRKEAAAARRRAWECFEAADYPRAREEFARCVQLDSAEADIWLGYGWCSLILLTEGGKADAEVLDACEPMFEKALRLHETRGGLTPNQQSFAHLQLAWVGSFHQDARAAESHLRAAIAATPESDVSVEARNELAVSLASGAEDDRELEAAQGLLEEALSLEPRHEQAAANLKKIKLLREGVEVLFRVLFPMTGGAQAVVVHPDETLGEVAARVLPELGLSAVGGMFICSDDDALPYYLDSGYRESHQTIREVGLKARDTILYLQLAQPPGGDYDSVSIRTAEQHLREGRPALARRQLRDAIETAKRRLRDEELDECQLLLNSINGFDPHNEDARLLGSQLREAIARRDAGSASADGENWPHSHGGPTRVSQTARGPELPLQPAWAFNAGARLTPPVIAGGCVYAGSWDRRLFCLDSHSGEVRWTWAAGGIIERAPAATSETVLVVDAGSLNCLDARTGRGRWRREASLTCSPLLDGGRVFVADDRGVLLCLEADTGAQAGAFETDVTGIHSLALSGNNLFAATDCSLLCVDLSVGRLKWSRAGQFYESMPAVAYDGVYVGTFAEGLWCLDAETGLLRWVFSTEVRVKAAAAAAKGRIYFGDTGGRFACLDALTGALLWKPEGWYVRMAACSAAPVVAGSSVYVLQENGVLHCLDALTGAEVWRGAVCPEQAGAGAFAVAGGAVYYVTHEGELGCLGGAGFAAREQRRATAAVPERNGPSPSNEQTPKEQDKETEPPIRLRDIGRKTALPPRRMDELHSSTALLSQNRVDEGVAILQRLQRDYPDEAIVLHNLGNAYEWQGLVGEALAVFDHMLELEPDDALAFDSLGRLLRTHADIIRAIYGPHTSFCRPPQLGSLLPKGPGLTPLVADGEAVILVHVEESLAELLAGGACWYWWQLIQTPRHPVLRLSLEFDHQPHRNWMGLAALCVTDPATQDWLQRLQLQESIVIHVFDHGQAYHFSTALNQSAEQRARLRALHGRALEALAAIPATARDFEAALAEAESLWEGRRAIDSPRAVATGEEGKGGV